MFAKIHFFRRRKSGYLAHTKCLIISHNVLEKQNIKNTPKNILRKEFFKIRKRIPCTFEEDHLNDFTHINFSCCMNIHASTGILYLVHTIA